jgi:hypothetical protein
MFPLQLLLAVQEVASVLVHIKVEFEPSTTVVGLAVRVTVGVVPPAVTVTIFVPVALVYVAELVASGVYVAVSVSVPVASEPAGTVIVALPLIKVVVADV